MKRACLCCVLLLFAVTSRAQNTGAVFSPVVTAGHKSIQYRAAVDPDNQLGKTGFAQRLHYQQSIDGDLMWRVIGQTRKTRDSDVDFDFVQAELFWDMSEDGQNYRTGMRFDVRVRDGDRPDQLGVNWMNQFHYNNGWSARALLLGAVEVGSNSADGVNVQTRWQLAKRLEGDRSLGVEMFNNYGNTDDIGSFDEQSHTVGPIYSMPLNTDWAVFTGVLWGLSNSAPDTELRVWLTRRL